MIDLINLFPVFPLFPLTSIHSYARARLCAHTYDNVADLVGTLGTLGTALLNQRFRAFPLSRIVPTSTGNNPDGEAYPGTGAGQNPSRLGLVTWPNPNERKNNSYAQIETLWNRI